MSGAPSEGKLEEKCGPTVDRELQKEKRHGR